MTDPNDTGAIHSAQNDGEFPDDERGLTGTREDVRSGSGATGPEGQTARDVLREDNGVPDVSQDDFPTALPAGRTRQGLPPIRSVSVSSPTPTDSNAAAAVAKSTG